MMDRDTTTRTGARTPGAERSSRSNGGAEPSQPLRHRAEACVWPRDARRAEADHVGDGNAGSRLNRSAKVGRHRLRGQPWSRTGENPPYGILGRTMETSASFEARSTPSFYPTIYGHFGAAANGAVPPPGGGSGLVLGRDPRSYDRGYQLFRPAFRGSGPTPISSRPAVHVTAGWYTTTAARRNHKPRLAAHPGDDLLLPDFRTGLACGAPAKRQFVRDQVNVNRRFVFVS